MNSIKIIFSFLLVGLLLSSCGEDTDVDTTVNFRLTYEGDPLVMFDQYTYPDGRPMNFTRVSFYVENLQLVGQDETFTLVDRDYVDLTNDHLTMAQSGVGYSAGTIVVPEGTYQLQFGIGVSPEDNAKVPADFDSNNLLSSTAEYWVGWKSYIFTRVEGKIDLNNDGVVEEGFALHMGADQAYLNVSKEITVSQDDPVADIEINLERLFDNNGIIYDIDANPQIHRPDQNDVMMQLVGNFATCFE